MSVITFRPDPNLSEPLYQQVMRAISESISTGRLNPGQRLPSERTLCETFGISRVTARRALAGLVEEGLLEASPGKGWFVASEPLGEPPNLLLSFTAMARARGLEPSASVLKREVRSATIDEAEQLRIAPGASILELERVRLLDGIPVALNSSLIPLTACDSLADVDFEVASLYSTLQERCARVPTHADYAVQAVASDKRLASLLDLEPNSPALLILQRTFDQTDAPLEIGQMVYRGDRYRFRARIWQRSTDSTELGARSAGVLGSADLVHPLAVKSDGSPGS